jgi:hypothetical protein
VVDVGRFVLVGSGDLSVRDMKAVRADLRESGSPQALFVCVARPREIEEVLAPKGSSSPAAGLLSTWGTRRIRWSTTLKRPIAPTLAAVSRGARLALLPEKGVVWVDGERSFTPGESVPLPWTDPPVSLEVVRPRTVLDAMRAAVGPNGPKRATLLDS